MSPLTTPVGQLSIGRMTLEQVRMNVLQHWLEEIYCKHLICPEYLLLNEEDRVTLNRELTSHLRRPDDTDKHVVQVANYTTGSMMYLASLPDLPREAEYTRAHLTFARYGYEALPTLERGEVLIIFPC